MEKDELLKKFFDNKCSEEETKLALRYLRQDPYLLDKFHAKSVWDEIDVTKPLHPDIEDEIRSRILLKTSRKRIFLLQRSLAVAASVIGVVIFSFILFRKPEASQVISTAKLIEQSPFQKVRNDADQNSEISLPDQSLVTIYPGAEIEYPKDFQANRSIHLSGKAVFKVASNKKSPFTVSSQGISTTALGTVFMVDSRPGNGVLNVELYEGKVVVKSLDTLHQVRYAFLKPGEQCLIDLSARSMIVNSLLKSPGANPAAVVRKHLARVAVPKPTALNFIQKPLPDVFAELQIAFGKKILYDANDIEDDLFTGRVEGYDSLESIMKLIATINDLDLVENKGELHITKKRASAKSGRPQYLIDLTQKEVVEIPEIPMLLSNIPMARVTQSREITILGDEIYFVNAPLQKVFGKIRELSGVDISFNEAELVSKYFSGKVTIDKSLVRMLKLICNINGLEIQKQKAGYLIVPVKE